MSDSGNKPVALVTGAAQGIGVGIARVMGEAGFSVVLGDVDGELVASSAAELRGQGIDAIGLTLDVTRSADWTQADREGPRHAGAVSTSW